jgi:hypothetical protein
MQKNEFIQFCDNDFELEEDEEWDEYSLLNGNNFELFLYFSLFFMKLFQNRKVK